MVMIKILFAFSALTVVVEFEISSALGIIMCIIKRTEKHVKNNYTKFNGSIYYKLFTFIYNIILQINPLFL